MASSAPPFIDPFRGRADSSSSSGSEYVRPNAFAGHLDTLARVHMAGSVSIPSSARSSVSIDSRFAGHRDTLARIPRFYRRGGVDIPLSVVSRLLHFLPQGDYLSLRLVCRHWQRSLPRPNCRASYRLPPEMLHIIFGFLAPSDFDAARHTCRQWFHAGMELALLRLMLRAAQCQHAFKADIKLRALAVQRTVTTPLTAEEPMSDEWLMAKRLATTSRLSSDWRGPGSRHASKDRLYPVDEIDFRRILLGQSPHVKTFTVSACGKYILVVSGRDVFVYGMTDSMGAVVRLAADRGVLQVSMDTSSGRYAVAALLENRVGILWDLNDEQAAGPSNLHSGEPMTLGMRTEVHGSLPLSPSESSSSALPLRRRHIDEDSGSGMMSSSINRPEASHATSEPDASHSYLFGGSIELCSTPEEELEPELGGIAVQTRVSAVYRNLGSSDDVPRSVAICPQRKCVAYGCRLGIELHWVDALTGGDLHRWFPLAATSDFLYFLPQRQLPVDNSKKLRLISSAAGPSGSVLNGPSFSRAATTPIKIKERAPTHNRERRQSMTRLFFGNLPFPASAERNGPFLVDDETQGVLRTVDCDHFQAIPLSDGFHMLYTDPNSGLLCLGSDAPLGGPTKLIRKLVFVPPGSENGIHHAHASSYNAGHDLDWGISIIAAHLDGQIVLYHVPSDVWEYVRSSHSTSDAWDENSGVLAQSDLMMDDVLSRIHDNASTDPSSANDAALVSSSTPQRTVEIHGSVITHSGRDIVDDIAIDTSNGGFRAWIFYRSGIARQYSIFADAGTRQRHVREDGLLYEARNGKGKAKDRE